MSGSVGKFAEIVELVPEVINMIDAEDGNSLLHWTAACNEIEMAKLLVEGGAKSYKNHLNKTPYEIAFEAYKRPDASYYKVMGVLANVPPG